MFDIGLWEIVLIAIVFLFIMGPERLPGAARQAAQFVRAVRQWVFRLRQEMQGEIDGSPLGDLEKARQEIRDLKRDIQQMGADIADSQKVVEQKIEKELDKDVDVTASALEGKK